MRLILKLSMVAFIWISVINALFDELSMDIKLVCDGRPIMCVCNHGAEPYTGLYKFSLDLSMVNKEDTSFESIKDEMVLKIISQFQSVGVLDRMTLYNVSSIQLIKKDPTNAEGWGADEECESLFSVPIARMLERLKASQDIALEINVEQEAQNASYEGFHAYS